MRTKLSKGVNAPFPSEKRKEIVVCAKLPLFLTTNFAELWRKAVMLRIAALQHLS